MFRGKNGEYPATWGTVSGNLSKLCEDLASAFSNNTSVRLGINDGGGCYTVVELMPMIDYYGNMSACFGSAILGVSNTGMSKATIGFSFEDNKFFTKMERIMNVNVTEE